MAESLNRFERNGSHCDQQHHSVGQRRQDGGSAQAIRAPRAGGPSGEKDRRPGEEQAEHVAEVVPGVLEQRE